MSEPRFVSRRRMLRTGGIVGAGVVAIAALAGCGEAQIVEKEVIKVVTQEVPVEKIVTQIVEKEKIVEKIVTAEASKPMMVTGEVLYWNYMTDMANTEQPIVNQFQLKNPEVKLKSEWIPWEQYWQKLNAALNAGSGAPDIWNTAPTFYYQYVNLGQLLQLDEFIKRDIDVDAFWQRTLGQWRAPQGTGPFFGLPRNYVLAVIFYNKSLFDAAGVDVPNDTWTIDDLLAAANATNKPTGDPKTAVFGFDIPGKGNRVFLDPLIYANGGRVLNETLDKSVINNPVAVETIQWVADLYQKWKVAPLPGFFEGLGDSFQTGRVAMSVNGSWAVGNYRQIRAFDWDIAMFPKGKQSRVTYGGPDGFVISKQTKNGEGAWELLKHMISDDSVITFYLDNPGMVPIKKSLANDQRYLSMTPPDLRVLLRSEPFMAADFNPNYNEWQTAKVNVLDEVWLGKTSAADGAAAADKAIAEILARSK